MKRAIVEFPIYVKDNYEPGDCDNCPFVVTSSYESFPGYYRESKSCKFKFSKETCPITIKDRDKDRDTYKPKDNLAD